MEYSYTQDWGGTTLTITYPDKVTYQTAFDITFSVDASTMGDYDAIAFLSTLGMSKTVDLSQATWDYSFVSADSGWNYSYTGVLGDSTTPWSATDTQYIINFADPLTSPYTWLWGYYGDMVTWSINGMIIQDDTTFTLRLDDQGYVEGPIDPAFIVLDPPALAVPASGGEDPPQNTVESSVDYTLAAGVKNLVLTGPDDISGTGNELDNVITGNTGNNVLDGASGADTLIGSAGDDTYVVDMTSDTVVEAANEGVDTVLTSVSYALSDYAENLTLTGAAELSGTGNALDNVLTGNSAGNMLYGDAGNDTLIGWNGNDNLDGGAGDDTYAYNLGDGLDELVDSAGVDELRLGAGLSLDNVAIRVTAAGSGGVAHLRVLDSSGGELPDQGIDFAVARDASGAYVSPIEAFTFADGSTSRFDDVLIKTQFAQGTAKTPDITTGRNDDVITAGPGANVIHSGSGNDIVYSRGGRDTVFGEGGNDFLRGGNGNDVLDGGFGIDLLQGGNGNDILRQQGGNSALIGGIGRDLVSGGAGNDFIAGGQHDDAITTGGGTNVVAFNRNDHNDTVVGTAGSINTLSLGGGIHGADLTLSVQGDDLVLSAGHNDSITFTNWYVAPANRNFVTLQLIEKAAADLNKACCDSLPEPVVQSFDFVALTAQFDEARTANPKLGSWALMNGLLDAHLFGSDTAALGGDLAYHYGMRGDLDGMNLVAAQETLKDESFGSQAQTVHQGSSVNTGAVPLV
jgi:Ca2+-binding RTX toxin-like protein